MSTKQSKYPFSDVQNAFGLYCNRYQPTQIYAWILDMLNISFFSYRAGVDK